MSGTTRMALGFVVVGEIVQLLIFAMDHALGLIHSPGLAFPIFREESWFLILLLGAAEPGSGRYTALICLLMLPPLVITGYAYSRLMIVPFLRTKQSPWIRVVAGAAAAVIVAFALDVIVHWWNLRWCHQCSVTQHFPPARLLHFVSRFLQEFGLTAAVVGALCALVVHRKSWIEYAKDGGLDVGQLH